MSDLGVIFDLDGLLVDSERLQERAFNIVLARWGIVLTPDDFGRLVGISTLQNFIDIRSWYPRIDADVPGLIALKDEAYAGIVATDLEPMPGAVRLVESLAAEGIPMAVASSSAPEDVRMCLAIVGLDRWIPRIASGVEVPRTKPAPDVYLRALDLLGLPAARCVALEDASAGVRAAAAAGIACVAVPNRYTRDHDLSRAARVVASLEAVDVAFLRDLAGRSTPGAAD